MSGKQQSSTTVSYWPLLAGLALGLLGFFGQRQLAAPAPFGVPLPVPQRQWVTEGVSFADADVLNRRSPPAYLEFLALQPDGTVPLRYPYDCGRAGFSIMHPMGAELVQFTNEQFFQNRLDALVTIKFNQPLKQIRYVLPVRRANETVEQYVARRRHELEQGGAVFIPGQKPLELPRYRFQRLEFKVDNSGAGSGATDYHFLFVGPLGPYALELDFVTTPELADLARPQVEKILGSFKPRLELALVMLEEDPNYGEWGGTRYVELAQKKKKEREQRQAELNRKAAAAPAQPGRPGLRPAH